MSPKWTEVRLDWFCSSEDHSSGLLGVWSGACCWIVNGHVCGGEKKDEFDGWITQLRGLNWKFTKKTAKTNCWNNKPSLRMFIFLQNCCQMPRSHFTNRHSSRLTLFLLGLFTRQYLRDRLRPGNRARCGRVSGRERRHLPGPESRAIRRRSRTIRKSWRVPYGRRKSRCDWRKREKWRRARERKKEDLTE